MEENKYGLLVSQDIKLHRKWFDEMVKLWGIQVIYRAPKPNKHYTSFTELDTCYEKPMLVGCILEEHPQQQTMKKLGWDSELTEDMILAHVPYNLEGLQVGALFIIPSAIDHAEGRMFRVAKMTTEMIYPSSVVVALVPEWEDAYTPTQSEFKHTSFNLLNTEQTENI